MGKLRDQRISEYVGLVCYGRPMVESNISTEERTFIKCVVEYAGKVRFSEVNPTLENMKKIVEHCERNLGFDLEEHLRGQVGVEQGGESAESPKLVNWVMGKFDSEMLKADGMENTGRKDREEV